MFLHLSPIVFFLIEQLASYAQYNTIFLQKSINRHINLRYFVRFYQKLELVDEFHG